MKYRQRHNALTCHTPYAIRSSCGFTLIETLVAISVLTTAIVAPMTLAARALSSAYYARDQVAAFHLAQEAIEAVRSIRDGNILQNAISGSASDLLNGIPVGVPFTIDTRNNSIVTCSTTCAPLETDGSLYGYGDESDGWKESQFTRTVIATHISAPDEVRISVTITWKTGSAPAREFTIAENLYQWIQSGSAAI